MSLPRCWLQAPLTDSLHMSTRLSCLKGKKCSAFTVLLILRLQPYLCLWWPSPHGQSVLVEWQHSHSAAASVGIYPGRRSCPGESRLQPGWLLQSVR